MNGITLGSRIRQAREQLNMPQEELAALVSHDQRAISEYENGKRKLAAVELPTFARVLHVPLLYFYEGELGVDDLNRDFVLEFEQLPTQEAKQTALELMRTFSSFVRNNRPQT